MKEASATPQTDLIRARAIELLEAGVASSDDALCTKALHHFIQDLLDLASVGEARVKLFNEKMQKAELELAVQQEERTGDQLLIRDLISDRDSAIRGREDCKREIAEICETKALAISRFVDVQFEKNALQDRVSQMKVELAAAEDRVAKQTVCRHMFLEMREQHTEMIKQRDIAVKALRTCLNAMRNADRGIRKSAADTVWVPGDSPSTVCEELEVAIVEAQHALDPVEVTP